MREENNIIAVAPVYMGTLVRRNTSFGTLLDNIKNGVDGQPLSARLDRIQAADLIVKDSNGKTAFHYLMQSTSLTAVQKEAVFDDMTTKITHAYGTDMTAAVLAVQSRIGKNTALHKLGSTYSRACATNVEGVEKVALVNIGAKMVELSPGIENLISANGSITHISGQSLLLPEIPDFYSEPILDLSQMLSEVDDLLSQPQLGHNLAGYIMNPNQDTEISTPWIILEADVTEYSNPPLVADVISGIISNNANTGDNLLITQAHPTIYIDNAELLTIEIKDSESPQPNIQGNNIQHTPSANTQDRGQGNGRNTP